MTSETVLDEHGRLTKVAVRHARDAFVSTELAAAQWKALNFSGPPDFVRAVAEYDRFAEILERAGAELLFLPADPSVTLDSIYPRDAAIQTPAGVVLCRMGKPARESEPAALARAFVNAGVPVVGSITAPGRLEGGDLIWLDANTIALGQGKRTNLEGIRQLQALVGPSVEIIAVPLPDYPGQHDVMHLMSLVSPVDRDLAVVYRPLLPEGFVKTLRGRGCELVEVPDAEFDTMGANVLAIAPRECVMLKGNPVALRLLERAGASVHLYEGREISLKGGGGPTCLTRPLARS